MNKAKKFSYYGKKAQMLGKKYKTLFRRYMLYYKRRKSAGIKYLRYAKRFQKLAKLYSHRSRKYLSHSKSLTIKAGSKPKNFKYKKSSRTSALYRKMSDKYSKYIVRC